MPAPGDEGRLTLDIDNASGAAGTFVVDLKTSGPVSIADPSHSVTLDEGARTTLSIPVIARPGYGTAAIATSLQGGKDINLTREFHMVVRAAWPHVSRLKSAVVTAGSDIAPDVTLRQGLYQDSIVQRISVGRLPPLPYAQSVQSLLKYPLGCAEQTTSKALPLVLLDDSTRKNLGFTDGMFRDDQGHALDLSLEARAEQVDVALTRLASMQGEDGHFAMWPGEFYAHSLITLYVTEMMLVAKDAGLDVPQTMLDKTVNVLLEDLLKGGNTHYEYEHYEHLRLAEMSHAAYVLAKAGKAPLGTLRALYDNESSKLIVPLPLMHLGVALSLTGDKQRGSEAINKAWTHQWQRPDWVGDCGSELRDQLLMAALAYEHGLATDAAAAAGMNAVRSLRGEQGDGGEDSEGQWLSTQEQIAMLRLGRALSASDAVTFDAVVADGSGEKKREGVRFFTHTLDAAVAGVRLKTAGEGELTVMHEVAGVPANKPTAKRDDMSIERRWFRTDGKDWSGESLKEGEMIVVRVTVKAARWLADALITELAPGGLEVENLNLTDPGQWVGITIGETALSDVIGNSWSKFEEYRDDRYVTAMDVSDGSTTERWYLLRAVTPGRYVIPPPVFEDMYRPNLRVIGDVDFEQVTVTPP